MQEKIRDMTRNPHAECPGRALTLSLALFLALASLLLPACDNDDPGSQESVNSFVPPDQQGPFAVGNAWYVMTDSSRWDRSTQSYRQLPVEVWYPADPEAAGQEQAKIIEFVHDPWSDLVLAIFSLLLPPDELNNLYQNTGSVYQAPVARASAPFPLIIFSHGNGGIRFQNHTLARHLASHGFIFAAPDHTENAVFTGLPEDLVIYNPLLMGKSSSDRPKDIGFIIDTLLELNTPGSGDRMEGAIDPDKIGVAGHSFGGQAVMSEVQMDDRIRAGLNLAGPWISIALFNLHVPMMYMIGLEDRTVGFPYNPFIVDTYEHSPAPRFLLEFPDGGHYTLTDACGLAPSLFGTGDGCGEGERLKDDSPFVFIDPDLAQDIQHGYVTAFFGLSLKGDERYTPYLSANHFPEYINFEYAF